jgi:hypothetical protein
MSDIEAGNHTSNGSWALLYSVLGYEARASKRAYVRRLRPDGAVPSMPIAWELYEEGGEAMLRGPLRPVDHASGIPLLEIDFTPFTKPGLYRLETVGGDSPPQGPGCLCSCLFPIGSDLLLSRTFGGIALDGAKARQAPISVGGGYYDSNAGCGDVRAHAFYAVGLMRVLESRGGDLSPLERAQVVWAVDRAIDYVLRQCDSETGCVAHQDRRRRRDPSYVPAGDTAASLWALATYADVFRGEEPARARDACYAGLEAERWLRTVVPEGYPSGLEASANASFWWHSGDPLFLDRAIDAIQTELINLGGRGEPSAGSNSFPRFEALYLLQKRLSRDPRVVVLLERARSLVSASIGGSQMSTWSWPGDYPWLSKLPHPLPHANRGHSFLLNGAIDAVYLSDMLRSPWLIDHATAGLGWISGLNLGVPGARVENPPSEAPIESAAFLHGIDARRVRDDMPWTWPKGQLAAWALPLLRMIGMEDRALAEPTGPFISVHSRGDLPNGSPHGASIGNDGLWLYAACLYGDYFVIRDRG